MLTPEEQAAFDAAYAPKNSGASSDGLTPAEREAFDRAYSNRPIAALNGGAPKPPGFGDTLQYSIDQAHPDAVARLASVVRAPLVTGLAGAAGTAAGLMSPVPGGAFMGGVAGGLMGDALNAYLDGGSPAEFFTPSNIARGALYGALRGENLLADVVKLAGGNAAIDAMSGQSLSGERTAAQTVPALLASAPRFGRYVGGLGKTAANEGIVAAGQKFLGTYKTPEQQALVAEVPELFPTQPTINVRSKQDILDEAGIVSGGTNPVVPEPKDGFWFRNVKQPQMEAYPELRSIIRYLKARGYPAAVEAAKRMEVANDLTRELRDTGKQITSEVLEKLSPEERLQFHKYMEWRDMDQKGLWADEVKLAGQLKDAGDSSLDSLVSTFDDETANEWRTYDYFRDAESTATPAVKSAADEIRARLLSKFDELNTAVGTKVVDPATGSVRDYMSAGEEFYPRIARESRPTENHYRTAIDEGRMTTTEAGVRRVTGRSPATVEVGRRTWLRTPGEFADNPQRTLNEYIDKQSKRIGRQVAFGEELPDTKGIGADIANLLGQMDQSGHKLDAEILERNLKSIYRSDPKPENFLGRLKRGVSNVALPFSAIAQIPQAATNVAVAGFGNTLKGMLRQGIEARKFRLSAANSPATKEYFESVNDITTSTIPSKAVGVVEQNWNRSNSAVGFGPHLRSLGQESLEHFNAGTEYPARLIREASFYGTTPEVLAKQTLAFGEPSWVRPMRQAIKNAQFHVDPGEVGEGFRTGPMSILTQYQSFPSLQSGFFKDQIVSPMLSGNMSEFDLGLARLARLVPLSAALTLPAAWAVDIAKGRELSGPADIASRVAGNVAGLYAAPLSLAASLAGGDKYNSRMAERAVVPPIVGMAQNIRRDGEAAFFGMRDGNLDPLAKLMLKDILPMANLSGTGLEGVVLPPAYKYLVEAPR